ncbi:methionine ABC transporter ATP-binding protein [Paenibacillus sp. SEL3]|jgi:D-methionine transport system ATP-binding protein|uniref:methionine ABC transporter ATP-binding protein n=1 Tax=Paenibacillus TaxID=44249 RepID=UPI0003FA93CE|nr:MULTISPECIES: ATP-binding cassette domain-containing protein [Paenibacillus]APB72893.1 L-cystine ABC transporter ATP-binding protein YecC [Paenibacillus polymyxa]KEO79641.1 methionine ABC transporter ATP-binding protein [Paenibacillus polymyxa]MBP1309367.1 D-methionine transport system ATP-binding protein [Paenibacillus sp. 1182]MCH6188552.1 ATP-binding cassette domain-containing protein [Paenibacillus polymyxa]MDY8093740.1 ATP-binding cassette domain-containing protein [Paenibacillus polym
MIELRNVSKTYVRKGLSIEALKNINIKVDKGDIFGFIGFSGAGKSTLIRLVNRLEKVTSGEVLVEGEQLNTYSTSGLRKVRKKIGMIFQHFNLLESKTVFDNIAIPLVLLKRNKREIEGRVKELLAFIGLSDKANSYPNELSGGQKQRVGIARALASNPSILLCDEATSALDPQTTQSILDLLRKINKEYKITILIITHEMSVIQRICNKVAVMEKGEIIEQGNVLEVFGQPQHPTTQSFVRTVIHDAVPESVLQTFEQQESQRIYKLEFIGQVASDPVVHELIRQHDIHVNILFANMTEIQETTIGYMTIQLRGGQHSIQQAVDFIKSKGVHIQEVESL